MGDILNLYFRSQEQNAKPSSFVAGRFPVLNWKLTCKFVHSLGGQLRRDPASSTWSPGTRLPGFWTAAGSQAEAGEGSISVDLAQCSD